MKTHAMQLELKHPTGTSVNPALFEGFYNGCL